VTCLISVSGMSHAYVHHDFSIMCDVTYSYVWRDSSYVCHDRFIFLMWLIHVCDKTHYYVRHLSRTHAIRTHSYVWHISHTRAMYVCACLAKRAACEAWHMWMSHDKCVSRLICMSNKISQETRSSSPGRVLSHMNLLNESCMNESYHV